MTRRRQGEHSKTRSRQEQTIDEMVDQTFPASDATQLPGRAAGAPDAGADRPAPESEFSRPQPRTIGNQGVPPSTRMKEERPVSLGGDAVVTFRFDDEARRLSIGFSEEGMMLDAAALDRLIAALSRKRAQMAE